MADSDAGLDVASLAESRVTRRPGVMGGVPCFTGTRIPIHDVADMMANGDTAEALAVAYPQLTIQQIEFAPVYAAEHPRPTRSDPGPAWRGSAPIKSRTVSTDDLPPAS